MRDLTQDEITFLNTVLGVMDVSIKKTYQRLSENSPEKDQGVDADEALYKTGKMIDFLKENPQSLDQVGKVGLELILQVIEVGIPDDLPPPQWAEALAPEVFSLIVLISKEILETEGPMIFGLN